MPVGRTFAAVAAGVLLAMPAAASPRGTPVLKLGRSSLRPGAALTLTGSGWLPGKPVTISVGQVDAGADRVGTVRATTAGTFRKTVRLSAKAVPGRYAFVACQDDCRRKRVAAFRVLAGGIESGRVVFGRSAAGVTLGQSRYQVVARLGTPLNANAARYLKYATTNLLDVYLDGPNGRVDLIGVAGRRFCTAEGICPGDVMREVIDRYGARVHTHIAPDEHSYVLESTVAGRRTYTVFLVENGRLSPDAKILQYFIGTCAGTSYCRGG